MPAGLAAMRVAAVLVFLALAGVDAAPLPPADASAEARAEQARATDRPGIALVVRPDEASSAIESASQRRAIEREVERIWGPYLRVLFVWPDALVAPGFDERLELVITSQLPPSGSADALGWVEFLTPERPGRVLTISVAAARRLAAQARWRVSSWPVPKALHDQFVARTLARSIAHELGHYLLRSSAHGAHGLMRARFAAADMFDSEAGFRLDPNERVAVEQYLRSLTLTRSN